MQIKDQSDTICALSTPSGTGALSVIRISGSRAIEACGAQLDRDLSRLPGYSTVFARYKVGERLIDEVLVTVLRGPRSFTGEDTVEISCHGSPYIQQQILQSLIAGPCRMAEPGEFSMRAFANGKMDLSRAEAIADLIASSSAASHRMAMEQLRGGLSRKINALRQELIDFASLIELELDFSEEDVEFADRAQLDSSLRHIQAVIGELLASFASGTAVKNGLPVAIVGAPNMGKSTLLNALLQEDRALVSDIPGTTRDSIEDQVNIGGMSFRFIDTAGIRDTDDVVEGLGIARTIDKARSSAVILYITDALESHPRAAREQLEELERKTGGRAQVITLANKVDMAPDMAALEQKWQGSDALLISAAEGSGLDALRERLLGIAGELVPAEGDTVVSNLRHFEALKKSAEALAQVRAGLESGLTSDLLALDIRQSLHHLGEITGEITTEDLLGNIFSRFCIGK